MRLLLDTHIWIWSLVEPERLTPRVARSLRSTESELWLSPISLWEFSLLVEKSRIEVTGEVQAWIDRAFEVAPMKQAPLTFAVTEALRGITTPHADPADRFLAATAAAFDLQLVTSDRRLISGQGYSVFSNR